ncbi:hypothetical protein ACWC24_32615 [Streptomyces sp. NPDC001443]
MAQETYRLIESTGNVGRSAHSRYSQRRGCWLSWEEWAAPAYDVTPDRLAAATAAAATSRA